MSLTSQDLLSAGRDGSAALWIRLTSWWSAGHQLQSNTPQTTLQLIYNPRLPPLLSPLPSLFRAVAFLIVAPIVFVCLVDFAGYAVFRTLGFNRRRVRVKAPAQPPKTGTKSNSAKSKSTAPVLTPGAYDADALMRHRERSASAASAEAIQEWTRTGGQFARVSNVRASKIIESNNAPSGTTSSYLTVPELISPPESPRNTFGRAEGVGVEGALGYFDTDAEDSGLESGQSSPEIGRRSSFSRKGLSGSALGFTPVSSEVGGKKALKLDVPYSATTVDGSDRSPKSNDSVTSSWIRLDESSNEDGPASEAAAAAAAEAATAADLEPETATT